MFKGLCNIAQMTRFIVKKDKLTERDRELIKLIQHYRQKYDII